MRVLRDLAHSGWNPDPKLGSGFGENGDLEISDIIVSTSVLA